MPRPSVEARARRIMGMVLVLIGLFLVFLGIPGLVPYTESCVLDSFCFGLIVIKGISEHSVYLLGAGVTLILIGLLTAFGVRVK